jgi:tripartite-type tricarboxylate transporter receptor subunit TctC
MNRRYFLFSIALCAVANISSASAQSSSQQMTLVAPTTPGGGIDTYARILAKEFTDKGQTTIVENRPGGGTNIGTNYVVRSEPNGKTVLITVNTLTINAAVSKSLPFDPMKDLLPVAYLGSQPFVIGVNPDVPAKNLMELIELLKKPGSQLTYSSCGQLTAQHLAGELLKSMTGGNMLHVPYRGCAPAIADVAGGQIQVSISPVTTTVPFVDAGKIRPLALTGAKRSPLLPNVPTAAEAGLQGYVADQWWGLFVPAKTPRSVVDRLNADVAMILGNQDVVKKLMIQGIEPTVSSPEEFGKIFREDIERWTKLARSIGLQAE